MYFKSLWWVFEYYLAWTCYLRKTAFGSTSVWFLAFCVFLIFCVLHLYEPIYLTFNQHFVTNHNIGLMCIFVIFNVIFVWVEKQNMSYLHLCFSCLGTEGEPSGMFCGLLGFLEESTQYPKGFREVRYSSGNKFKVGLLTLNKNERKNCPLNFVNDFPDFYYLSNTKRIELFQGWVTELQCGQTQELLNINTTVLL